jgi:hypothetical protein
VYGKCIASDSATTSYKDDVVQAGLVFTRTTKTYSDTACTSEIGSPEVASYSAGTCYNGVLPIDTVTKLEKVKKSMQFLYYNTMDECDDGDNSDVILGVYYQLDTCYSAETNSSRVFEKSCKNIVKYTGCEDCSCTYQDTTIGLDDACAINLPDDDGEYAADEYGMSTCDSAAAVGVKATAVTTVAAAAAALLLATLA